MKIVKEKLIGTIDIKSHPTASDKCEIDISPDKNIELTQFLGVGFGSLAGTEESIFRLSQKVIMTNSCNGSD